MAKKGDTLIEVTLAIGVFSMIAIAVVSVMNRGTSSTQSALETTLTREEIDAQAEALRFIHASYISDKDTVTEGQNRFQTLWRKITSLAFEGTEITDDITKFTPHSCDKDAYSGSAFAGAFIINTRSLGSFSDKDIGNDPNRSPILTSASTCNTNGINEKCLTQASTYPRVIYKSNSGSQDLNLIESTSNQASRQLYRAEGVYIVAVKEEEDGSSIISDVGTEEQKSAFYDFYIRSCWYSTGSSTPSTISTVIRLYDPDAVAGRDGDVVSFNNGDTVVSGGNTMSSIFVAAGKKRNLPKNELTLKIDKSLYSFDHWETSDGTSYSDEGTYEAQNTGGRKSVPLYAVWNIKKFYVDVKPVDEEGNVINGNFMTVLVNKGSPQPFAFGTEVKIELSIDTVDEGKQYTFDSKEKLEETLCQGEKMSNNNCSVKYENEKKITLTFIAKNTRDGSTPSGDYTFSFRPIVIKK